MILVAVGTQLPFDRLIRTVDQWAVDFGRADVVAQTGHTSYVPRAMTASAFISPDEFSRLQKEADVFIAHAGMGSILTAIEFGKPIVIMPRDHLRNEHRNAHQMATARRFVGMQGVHVAMNEEQLVQTLHKLDDLILPGKVSSVASDQLLSCLGAFIGQEQAAKERWELSRLTRSFFGRRS